MVLDRHSARIRDEMGDLRDFAPFPYQSLNTDGEIMTVNDAWLDALGYQLDEVRGRWFGDFLVGGDKARFESTFSEFKSVGEITNAEYEMQCADGETIFVSFRGYIEYDEDGSVHCTHCQFEDISEQKARERELRKLKERYQSFVDYSSDIITVTDSDGRMTYQSPAVEDVFGYEPDDMVGDKVFGYIHPDDRQVSENKFQTLATQDDESTETIEFRFEHPDGSYRWLESIGVDQTDSPIDGLVFYSREISERKADEKKLRQRNEQLDRFASIVSHDLRNPLNVAFARLELAQEECETPEHERIEMALGRIRGIIDDTLTLSRMGDTVDDTEKMDLRARITQCWDAVETGSSKLEPLRETSYIWADPERIRHVFENLFRNAVEHGGEGVTVSVDLLEDGFAVSDDGPGLPDEVDIFETGETTSEEGTGFGLTIVKEIVSAHGWEVQATESDAGGARFEITGVEFATE